MPNDVDEKLLEATRDLYAALDELGVTGVLIGGVAVSLLAEARFTRDVDAMILFDNSHLAPLLDSLASHGLVAAFQGVDEVARQARILPLRHERTGTKVDVALGCMPFEEEIHQRAREFREGDLAVFLPSPEDLVILKAIANREKDREDIRRIAQVYPSMDRLRIRRWVDDYGELLDTPDLWAQIEPLLG